MAGTLALGLFFYMPHADATVTGDEGGVYKVKAAGGVGYTYRWDADGDGKPDTADFGTNDQIEFRLDPGKSRKVVLEVRNAFGAVGRREVPVARSLRDGQSASLGESNDKPQPGKAVAR